MLEPQLASTITPWGYGSRPSPGTTCGEISYQSLLFGVAIKPRLCVGLIRISLMQTRGGRLATKAMVRPQSSGCSILACSASLGGTGRDLRMGVATSPGDRQQARSPLTHSSMLKEWVSASTACLVVV